MLIEFISHVYCAHYCKDCIKLSLCNLANRKSNVYSEANDVLTTSLTITSSDLIDSWALPRNK